MLERTHVEHAPWFCIKTDNKPRARENIMRHILKVLIDHKSLDPQFANPIPVCDPDIAFSYDEVKAGHAKLYP